MLPSMPAKEIHSVAAGKPEFFLNRSSKNHRSGEAFQLGFWKCYRPLQIGLNFRAVLS
jgi:hypothetical protein